MTNQIASKLINKISKVIPRTICSAIFSNVGTSEVHLTSRSLGV